jgi:hypothetical protein
VLDLTIIALHVANFTLLAWIDQPRRMLDMNEETNLPTWYAGTKLAFLGSLLALLAYARRRPADVRWWAMLGIASLPFYLSFDEFSQLHERLGHMFPSDVMNRTGLWMVIAVPTVVIAVSGLAVASAPYWAASRQAVARLALGVAVYVISAGLLEVLTNFAVPGSVGEHLQVLAEEGGELIAITLMVSGALSLLRASAVSLRVPEPGRPPSSGDPPRQT